MTKDYRIKPIVKVRRAGPIVINRELLESRAFRDLDGKAVKVLLWFFAKRKFVKMTHNRRKDLMHINNGELVFTYSEAEEKYGLSAQVFSRLIGELIKKGFIEINIQGIGYGKAPTQYALSRRWEDYGRSNFEPGLRRKRLGHRFPKGYKHPIHRRNKDD